MTDLPLIAVGVGILLVALSFAWPSVIGNAGWSQEQASEHAAAAAELHRLVHAQAHAQEAEHEGHAEEEHAGGSLEEARGRYERSSAMLEQARSYRRWTATILRLTGVFCTLSGAAGYFVLRSATG